MFGYHAGGWGKPPVDENGKPLYGDVFGTQSGEFKVSARIFSFLLFSFCHLKSMNYTSICFS